MRQSRTRDSLTILTNQIYENKKKTGQLPQQLIDIPDVHQGWEPTQAQPSPPRDAWGRAIQYKFLNEDQVELMSFGRDGLPGGIGLDADLYADRRNFVDTLPTFSQYFMTNDESEVNRNAFIKAGLLASIMVFITALLAMKDMRQAKGEVTTANVILLSVILVAIASLVGGLLLPVHIPNGH